MWTEGFILSTFQVSVCLFLSLQLCLSSAPFFLPGLLVSCVSLFQHWCALFLFLLLFSAFNFFFIPVHCTCMCACLVMWLFPTPWTVACQASLSMGFFRHGNWSALPIPTPGHLPDPGIKPMSFESLILIGSLFTSTPLGKPIVLHKITK